MNGELVPAVAAASVGSAMLATIFAHERLTEERMRRSRLRYSLRFPAELDPIAAQLALGALAGISDRSELVFEIAMTSSGVSHSLLVPESVRSSVVSGLTAAIPALRATETREADDGVSRIVLRVFVPTPCVLRGEHPEATLRTLAELTPQPGERVIVRLAVRPDPPGRLPAPKPEDRAAREIERAWRHKTTVSAGFRVAGMALVQAGRADRAGVLAGHLASIFRSRRGPVAGLRLKSERTSRSLASLPATTRSSGWVSTLELLPLLMWPMGEAAIPGVEVAARELAVPAQVPRTGRRLFIGQTSRGERPVALSLQAARLHMVVIGGSGTGKSTLLTTAALSDVEQGHAGVVIDPKADLLETIIRRVKPEHAERVVVLDPGDSSRPTPGIDVLGGGDPDLRTDVMVGALKSIFPDWGIRSETWGRLGIRTLSEVPGATLADIGRLFAEERYRRAAIGRLRDPFLISSWQNYDALSPGAKVEVVQAPMARVVALLSRPRVRAVLASPEPKLDVARLLAERKWLLVSLAPGVLGEAGAALIGAVAMYVVWSAIEARVALPQARRPLVSLYVDELATVTNGLPFGFELLAERARGLGAGLTVAIQTLGRIPEPTRSALIGNAASFISFRAPAEEAQRLARQLSPLTESDLLRLQPFQVGARIAASDGGLTVVTGQTEPLGPETGQASAIRDRSAALYGSEPQQASPPLEAADDDTEGESVGRTRRAT